VCRCLRPNVRLVMVHAINPYGFANLRRCNEDNVDLNRNFVDHCEPYPENQEYDQLADAIAPRTFSPAAEFAASLRILWYRLRQGPARLQHAVTHGQHAHPQGLFYGGRFAVWSNRVLHEIAERHLARAARVVVIDLHTGLGPYGYGEVIMSESEDVAAYRRAVAWWGKERVKSTLEGESVSAHLSGTVKLAFSRILPGAEVTAVGLEFGTLPPMQVFKALRAENWLYHHGGAGHADAAKIKQQFLRAFYPDDDLWKCKVWEQGRLVVEQALANL
ncbi:MAG: M14 family metallopeptidase, partial [Desulfuromonadales bacterium]|nr:M14 family metallopeptidase [Desulfuromonadales bacterium]